MVHVVDLEARDGGFVGALCLYGPISLRTILLREPRAGILGVEINLNDLDDF